MRRYEGRELAARLVDAFAWRTDRVAVSARADVTGWWRDPTLLQSLAPALADLHEERPTVVLGAQSRGSLLGALVAAHPDVGLVEARKEPGPASDSDQWLTRTTPPDYRDRHLVLGFRRMLVRGGDRVLFVDDWVNSGSTAEVCKQLVLDAGGRWVGAATIVDAQASNRHRRELHLRALVHARDLR